MSRKVPWRAECPPAIRDILNSLEESKLLVLQQLGPTRFVLKTENSSTRCKVSIGDIHTCTCRYSRRELCCHILFVLSRVFRIPSENPLLWQRSLLEAEVSSLVSGRLQFTSVKRRQCSDVAEIQPAFSAAYLQRDAGQAEDSVCPICYEQLRGKRSTSEPLLVYCRFGCGNGVHAHCFAQYAAHHDRTENSNGGNPTNAGPLLCPLCRAKWGPSGNTASMVHNRRCSGCRGPINGELYSCAFCSAYNLCHFCFTSTNAHSYHPFNVMHAPDGPVVPARRPERLQNLQGESRSAAQLPRTEPPTENDVRPHFAVSDLLVQFRNRVRELEGLQRADEPTAEDNSAVSSEMPYHNFSSSLLLRDLGPDDYEQLLALDESNPRQVLDEPSFNRLITNSSRYVAEETSPTTPTTCLICMEALANVDEWVALAPCNHRFHVHCAREWLTKYSATCPVDHTPILLEDEDEDVGGVSQPNHENSASIESSTDDLRDLQAATAPNPSLVPITSPDHNPHHFPSHLQQRQREADVRLPRETPNLSDGNVQRVHPRSLLPRIGTREGMRAAGNERRSSFQRGENVELSVGVRSLGSGPRRSQLSTTTNIISGPSPPPAAQRLRSVRPPRIRGGALQPLHMAAQPNPNILTLAGSHVTGDAATTVDRPRASQPNRTSERHSTLSVAGVPTTLQRHERV